MHPQIHRYDVMLTVKEVAAELSVGPSYIYAIKRQGFSLRGNRWTTVNLVLKWLDEHPNPRKREGGFGRLGGDRGTRRKP